MEQEGPAKKAPNRGQEKEKRTEESSLLSRTNPTHRGIEFVSQISVHQDLHEGRQSSDESRLNLLRSALGQELIHNDTTETLRAAEHDRMIQQQQGYPQPEEDSKPAARSSPSYSPSQDSSAIVAKYKAENDMLRRQLAKSREETRQVRQTMEEQALEALERHNSLYSHVIDYIRSCEEEKRRAARARQRAASMQMPSFTNNGASSSSDHDLLALSSQVNHNSSSNNNMRTNMGPVQSRRQQQSNTSEAMSQAKLAQSLLHQSTTRDARMLDTLDDHHHYTSRQERSFVTLNRDNGFLGNSVRHRDAVQAQLENLEREVQALKRRHQIRIDNEAGQFLKRKRHGGNPK